MLKRFLLALLCVFSCTLYAQNGSISPYSSFGIGELRGQATVENQSMGGLAMFTDSIHVNFQNPAAYGSLRVTNYAIGLSSRNFTLQANGESDQKIAVTSLDYLSVAFPVHPKISVGFGLQPLSSVGYALEQTTTNTENDTIINAFTGDGGLSRVFLSAGYQPIPNLNIGASVRYNFGEIDNNRIQSVQDVQFGTLDERRSQVSGFDFNYALTYTPEVLKKYRLHTYLGVDTQVNLNSENTQRIGSFSLSNGAEIEVIDVNLADQGLERTSIVLPTTFSFGVGLGEDKHWFGAVEVRSQDYSAFENAFLRLENVDYSQASTVIIGGYFIPDYDALSGIYNRVVYRAGIRFDKTGMSVNGEEINNFSVSFGLGIPMGGSFTERFSNLNVGLEFGNRGTTAAELVKENYFGIKIGLSLNDRWFVKRVIN